jgi:hypothetical protein
MKGMMLLVVVALAVTGCGPATKSSTAPSGAERHWIHITDEELTAAVGNLNEQLGKGQAQFPGSAQMTIETNGVTYKIEIEASRVKRAWKEKK